MKSKNQSIRTISFLITAGFLAVALDALLIMARWRLQGISEEDAAKWFTFGVILVPLLSYLAAIVVGILAEKITKNHYADVIAAAIIASASIGFFTKDILHAVFAFAFVLIVYYAVHTYKKGLASEA